MTRALAVAALAVAPLWAQISKVAGNVGPPAPAVSAKALRIAPAAFEPVERQLDGRLMSLFGVNEPLDLLGRSRGVYLDGYGLVFTAEISLVITPGPSPFLSSITKQMAERVRARKMERLPLLKAAMKDMMAGIARSFPQIPPDQQVVLQLRMLYAPWEDIAGMPSQLVVRADHKGALAGNIQVEEQ
jgi:hypothetical protein